MPNLNDTFESEWLKANVNVKHGDIIKFVDAGHVSDNNGKPRLDIIVKVSSTGKEKKLTVNATNRKRLQKMFGPNTDNWVGKEVEVVVSKRNNPSTGDLVDGIDLVAPGKYGNEQVDF